MIDVDYNVTRQDMEALGDELAAQFSRGDYEGVCDRILRLRTPEAVVMVAHVHHRLIGFQHSIARALYDCLVKRAEAAEEREG